MKIDHDYLKRLLEMFESMPTPTTTLINIEKNGFAVEDDQFIFHIRLLEDQGLVVNALDRSLPIVRFSGIYKKMIYKDAPIRLTAEGHDFLEAIKNKAVWEQIKSGFKDASLKTLINASQGLLSKYIQNKINDIANH